MNQKMLKPHRAAPASVREEMLQQVREGWVTSLTRKPPNQCRIVSGCFYCHLRFRISANTQGHLRITGTFIPQAKSGLRVS